MKIIEKIEIKHFRSFKETVKVLDLKDLNIFSGSNDVGKSNVLKVLNLFFNDEINIGEKFNLEKDLSFLWERESKEKIENRKTKRKEQGSYASQRNLFVSIKLHFNRPVDKKSSSPNKFWVEKRFDKNGLIGDYNTNIVTKYRQKNKNKKITSRQENAQKGQVTLFLNAISFEYIPAVKDRKFFKYLFKKLQNSLLDRDNSFQKFSNDINYKISEDTVELFNEFKNKTGIEANFEIPETLIDFFNTINVSTENGISLYSRGDGIQARFIPAILNEISKRKSKKYILWGFEEPENSYEYRAAEKLAEDFLNKYSLDKQIFITSHTKEFLSLIKNNEEKVSLYRVYKTLKGDSLIDVYKKGKGFNKQEILKGILYDQDEKKLKDEKKDILNKIFEDIGFLETDQYLIEDLQEQLRLQRQEIEKTGFSREKQEKIVRSLNNRIKKQLLNEHELKKEIEMYKKPILYIEDKYNQIYKIAYLKLKNIKCNEENLEKKFKKASSLFIYSKESANELNKFLDFVNISDQKEKKIVGLFDFDSAFNQFNGLSQNWSDISGDEETGLYRRRSDHDCFYSLLLPVSKNRKLYASKGIGGESKLEIELYFSDSVLKKLGNFGKESLPGVTEKRTIFIGKKKNFWKKLFDLPKEDFEDFRLLFDKIEELLK